MARARKGSSDPFLNSFLYALFQNGTLSVDLCDLSVDMCTIHLNWVLPKCIPVCCTQSFYLFFGCPCLGSVGLMLDVMHVVIHTNFESVSE